MGSAVGFTAEHASPLRCQRGLVPVHPEPPHDKPAWSLTALGVPLQLPLGQSWVPCPASVGRLYISLRLPFLLESFLFSEDIFTLETSSCLCSLGLYWEFLLGIPPLGILPPAFKGKNNNALH